MTVSVCMTVKDEAGSVGDLARDLRAQTLMPDEIVVTDGGSIDETPRILAEELQSISALKLIDLPGSNISEGRNRAISESTGDLIAIVDAGVRLKSGWLESLVRELENNPATDIVFGYILARPATLFETALGSATIPDAAEIDPERYAVSAGSMAFRREFCLRYPFPEWLDYGEDMYLDLRWRADGRILVHSSGADVGFRPRYTMGSFFRQYFNYARGDGQGRMWLNRHLMRYAAYLGGGALMAAAGGNPLALALAAGGGVFYLRRPYRRLMARIADISIPSALFLMLLLPAIRAVGDVAKMLGFLAGLCESVTARGRAR